MGQTNLSGPLVVEGSIEAGDELRVAGKRTPRVLSFALAGVVASTGGALGSIANPEGATVLITRVVLHLTTESTGAATADIGVAADATTSDDTLLDGVNVGAAAGIFDNIDNQGANGKAARIWSATQFVTLTGSASTADLVGTLYIEYILI